jgi:hypothetical protein
MAKLKTRPIHRRLKRETAANQETYEFIPDLCYHIRWFVWIRHSISINAVARYIRP